MHLWGHLFVGPSKDGAQRLPLHRVWPEGGVCGGSGCQSEEANPTRALRVPLRQEPSVSAGHRDAHRPKADLFFATYRLPGASTSHTTAARTLTAGAGKAPPPGAAALAGRTWSATLGHNGRFQVGAGIWLGNAETIHTHIGAAL